jgi:hypothetical protein
MQHYVITTDGNVRSYKRHALALAMCLQLNAASSPEQTAYVASDDDKGLADVPSALLVTLHNIIRPEKPIKKFADRETAERRMKGVLEVLAKPGEAPQDSPADDATTGAEGTGEGTQNEDPSMATKAKRTRAAKKTTTTAGEGAGRPSAFAGKVIRKVADKNPRREGTHGFNSWECIKNGMSYEKYLEAGGRRTDLAWDLAKGYVKLEKA